MVWFIDRRGAQCTTAVLSPQPDLRRRGPVPVASWRLQGTRADKPCVPSRASHSDLSEHPCPNRRHDALLYDRTMDLVSHFVFGFELVVRAFAYPSDRARTNRSMGRLLRACPHRPRVCCGLYRLVVYGARCARSPLMNVCYSQNSQFLSDCFSPSQHTHCIPRTLLCTHVCFECLTAA